MSHAAGGGDRAARCADAALLTAVARIAAAAVEGEPSLAAAPAMAALLQALVEHVPQRGATYATAVLEVLFAVNLEAVADRAEALRGPVYVSAVERVLPEAMFPDGYEAARDMGVPDGEEEMEEEEFNRFRRTEVADLLAQTCNLCGFGCAVDSRTSPPAFAHYWPRQVCGSIPALLCARGRPHVVTMHDKSAAPCGEGKTSPEWHGVEHSPACCGAVAYHARTSERTSVSGVPCCAGRLPHALAAVPVRKQC